MNVSHWLIPLGMKRKPRDPNAPRYGDIYERSLAVAIDLIIIYFLLDRVLFQRITQNVFKYLEPATVEKLKSVASTQDLINTIAHTEFLTLWLINAGLHFVIIAAIIVGVQISYGNTLGKWLLGLKIVRRGTHEAVEPWRFIVRIIASLPAAAPFMVGILWISLNKERRGWHDMVAGTVVLHTRPNGWYWTQVKRAFAYCKRRIFPSSPVE